MVTPVEPNQTMSSLTVAFLQTLNPQQLERAVFPFESCERLNWHYIPRQREGFPLKEMNASQRTAAELLLRFAMSEVGYRKVTDIMRLEEVLRQMGGSRFIRDPEQYAFTVFGNPLTQPWGWRVEGHHLSLNFTVFPNDITTVTPAFLGANPACVPLPPLQGLRTLAREQELARDLVSSLDSTQLERAVIASQSFGDILTGPLRAQSLNCSVGLPLNEMDDRRRDLAMRLIEEYIRNMRGEFAEAQLQRVRSAGIDQIHFAWAGGREPGQAHYYRLQGPVLLIEYDNTHNNANHIHSVLRDPTNDFGVDSLREHYETSHNSHHHAD